MKHWIWFALVLGLAGCAALAETHTTIVDLESDKVVVQADGMDFAIIDATARQACGLHGRTPQRLSYTCASNGCLYKNFLYACVE